MGSETPREKQKRASRAPGVDDTDAHSTRDENVDDIDEEKPRPRRQSVTERIIPKAVPEPLHDWIKRGAEVDRVRYEHGKFAEWDLGRGTLRSIR